MPRRKLQSLFLVAAACGTFFAFGCKDRAREARERAELKERMAAEEAANRAPADANRAITEMNQKAFRKRAPEEEAAHKAEVARQMQTLLKEQREAETKKP